MKFFCNHGYHLSSHMSNGVCAKINSALSDFEGCTQFVFVDSGLGYAFVRMREFFLSRNISLMVLIHRYTQDILAGKCNKDYKL